MLVWDSWRITHHQRLSAFIRRHFSVTVAVYFRHQVAIKRQNYLSDFIKNAPCYFFILKSLVLIQYNDIFPDRALYSI
ncbi:hypothetical protein U1D46_004266 [Cronobacter dublinensis]|nr:hypothetical protein [Cronobacter dublinensis]